MDQPTVGITPDLILLLDGFWSTAHAAKFCDCSQDKVERWIKAGVLTAYDIGENGRSQFRVAKAEVIAFMRRRRVAHATESPIPPKSRTPAYQGRVLKRSQ